MKIDNLDIGMAAISFVIGWFLGVWMALGSETVVKIEKDDTGIHTTYQKRQYRLVEVSEFYKHHYNP